MLSRALQHLAKGGGSSSSKPPLGVAAFIAGLPFQPRRYKHKKQIRLVGKKRVQFTLSEKGDEITLPAKVKGYTRNELAELKEFIKTKLTSHSLVELKGAALQAVNEFAELKYAKEIRRIKYRKHIRKIWRQKRSSDYLHDKINRIWQHNEDLKEIRVKRDITRAQREERGEKFIMRRFLRVYKEFKKPPVKLYPDAKTFYTEVLEADKQVSFFKGPLSSRKKKSGVENYKTRWRYEIWDPFWYELRRKVRVTTMVQARQKNLDEAREKEEFRQARIAKALRNRHKHEERMAHWNKVMGAWYAENDKLRALKNEYRISQEQVLSKSRREFLLAFEKDVNLWIETPDECKYMRFDFGEGIKFPYRRTAYS